ncbi:MAG: hypothetical protein LC679_05355, partial [Intrasporangiaceae bacterium]|nr:hypothetical protein [Intrasporangiaceae bacterium]
MEAVALFEHLGPLEQCSTLITLGYADLSLRDLDDAVTHLDRARTIAAQHHLEAHLFKATHNLGCVHYVAGDVPRALALMTEADAMPVEVTRDRAQLDHAEALMDAGLVDEAGELLRTALDDARAAEHRLDEGDILLDLARCALLREDRAGARRRARQAVAAFRTRQAESRQALAELFLAGLDLGEGRPLERAFAAATRYRAVTPRTAEEVEATLLVAEAESIGGRPERARAELDRLAPSPMLRLPVQLHKHYLRARVAHETGDDRGFAAAARAASEILVTAQSAVQSLELRAALAQHAVRLAQLDLARSVESGSVGACIDTIERWRAASARAHELRLTRDPETTALLQELRWLSSAVSPAAETDPALREARIAELQRDIAARAWRHDRPQASGVPTETMTHVRLLTTVERGTAYLTFAETGGYVYAALADSSGDGVLRRVGTRDEVTAQV